MGRKIRLTEEDLHRIVKESVDEVLNEGFFDFFKKRGKPNEQNLPNAGQNEMKDHIYSVQELQQLYNKQTKLTPFEWKVLNAAMWVRAMQANYHGYAKKWPNVYAKGGNIYYWDNGDLKKVP